eukprot:scaffold140364_cov59-Attheya_sp.AAC.1
MTTNGSATVGTNKVKMGLAQMLKGGVIVSSHGKAFVGGTIDASLRWRRYGSRVRTRMSSETSRVA